MAKPIPILSINTSTPPARGKCTFQGVFVPNHVPGTRDYLFAVLYDTSDMANFKACSVGVKDYLWTVDFTLAAGKTYAFMVYTGTVCQPGQSATWTFYV